MRTSGRGGGRGHREQRDAGILHGAHVFVPEARGHRSGEDAVPTASADGDGALRVGLLGLRDQAVLRMDGVRGHRRPRVLRSEGGRGGEA